MPDALATALAQPGLVWLGLAAFLAGTVRGFSGFGTALIFLPVAGMFLPPVWAILALIAMDILGPVPNLPRSWRDCDRGDLFLLCVGALVVAPFGLALLLAAEPQAFRLTVSGLTFVMVICLAIGLRFRGRLGTVGLFGLGAAGGFTGGFAGLPGPPVILGYMSGPYPAGAVRANMMLYLFFFDALLAVVVAVQGAFSAAPLLLGLILAVPNLLGNMAGAAVFKPGAERIYRVVALVIIAGSAVLGLPFWE